METEREPRIYVETYYKVVKEMVSITWLKKIFFILFYHLLICTCFSSITKALATKSTCSVFETVYTYVYETPVLMSDIIILMFVTMFIC